jgi:hypothetical protein
VLGTLEPGHFWSDLGQAHLSQAALDAGNGLEAIEVGFVGV